MRKATIAILGAFIVSMAGAAAHADSYDIGTGGLTANYSGGVLSIDSPAGSTFTVQRNGVTVTTIAQSGSTSDFVLNATLSPATGTSGTVTTSGTSPFFMDDVPGGPSANAPDITVTEPLTGTFNYAVMGGNTYITLPNFNFNGTPESNGLLRLMGFTPSGGTASNVVADFTFATPLPSTLWAGVILLAGMFLVNHRIRRAAAAV